MDRISGYGADMELDDGSVTLYPGKAMARMSGAERIVVPLADLAEVTYRAANMMTNGRMRLVLRDPSTENLYRYAGKTAPVFTEEHTGADVIREAKGGMVTTETLVIHWRKKDQAAFEKAHRIIESRLTSV